MNKSHLYRIAGVAAVAISATVAAGLPAQAASPSGSTRGTCTESSNIRLTVNGGQQGKLNVKAQITRGQRGDRIGYVISDNGNKAKIGNKNTGMHGKTTVSAVIRNVQGRDTILFTSTNTDTTEICTAQVIFRG